MKGGVEKNCRTLEIMKQKEGMNGINNASEKKERKKENNYQIEMKGKETIQDFFLKKNE